MKHDPVTEVSAFAAKTHLSELLREAERGRSFLIHRRGKPVARLVPVEKEGIQNPKELLGAFQAIRRRGGRPLDVRKLIEEGRRR